MGKKQFRELKWLKEAIKNKYPDAKILLFGSRARGDNLKSSDYDILVLSDAFRNTPFRERLQNLYDIINEPMNLEIICLTHTEYHERKNELSIIREIAKEAIPV